ncbi:MAG: ferredoxin family protein [Bacteroidales bacterium]
MNIGKRMNDRHQTSFVSIDPRRCEACWRCISTCPKGVLGRVEFLWHRHVVIKNPDHCVGCLACMDECPAGVFSSLGRKGGTR